MVVAAWRGEGERRSARASAHGFLKGPVVVGVSTGLGGGERACVCVLCGFG